MFFKKKKPKLNSKVRFQHKQFTGKLQTARNYKRKALAIPETQFDKILAKVGLGSKWAQIGAGVILLGLIYLVYLPNFLTVQKITITGLSESQTRDLEIAVRDEIANTNFFYPEKNLLFLRSDKVVRDATKNLASINKIEKVSKSLSKQELIISAESKYEKFLVSTPNKVYDVYNDGLLKGEAGVGIDQWQNLDTPSMLKIKLTGEVSADKHVQLLNPNLVNYLNDLNNKISQVPNAKLAYYQFKETKEVIVPTVSSDVENPLPESTEQIPTPEPDNKNQTLTIPINSAEVHAVFYKGTSQNTYRVIFDATKDVQKSIDNLKLLLSQTSPERLAQLNYIDLRLEERAYLCLQGAACNK